jgi:hypothetical protein
MEEFKIEKNIPISQGKYYQLLSHMEVGDSFVVQKKKYNNGHFTRLSKTLGIKLTSRSVTEHPLDKGDFLRVWRVE